MAWPPPDHNSRGFAWRDHTCPSVISPLPALLISDFVWQIFGITFWPRPVVTAAGLIIGEFPLVDVPLKCSCGEVAGTAVDVSARNGTRVVCYCDDCQTFARHLGRGDDILTEQGGTELFQIYPCQFEITKGADKLRSLRLKPGGLLRWYTDCCNTPVANTISAKMPFVGIFHNFMDNKASRDKDLGPVRCRVQGKYALGKSADTDIHPKHPVGLLWRIVTKMLMGKLTGKNSPNTLFGPDGRPVSKPVIVSAT
jgi:hypothetical protein